ncbi:NADH-quinone oxidoreductase subunit NuoE [Candidatus Poribacteria bacterium]|jgi:NADH dehydrogenase (ubiquinone) flavoprotein 2|nr:NADH-quinone oxidoreductase subunit NuoE [Candidatus Poribacteria bacterium]MBT7101678.1 NADH-quinone oxidoreductase subunit NuoE [Candidatus Poribacteria bacterium]MBT7808667.1 NADH-quinone oxidoreductase subunit NuoE [Candidatus Poribacteria bacterium]
MSFEYTPENLATFEELVTHYPDHYRRAVTLPALHLAQRQNGWCSPDVMEYIAALVGTSPAQVRDVVTFYPMFFEEPVGKYIVRVCHTLPCDLCGCAKIKDHLTEKLGVGMEATTEDGKITLLSTECLAACDQAPVMMIDDDLHGLLTPEKVDELIDGLE